MRTIYADALVELVDEEWFDCQEKSSFLNEIDRTPTIDAVPIVRCKDCKHRPIDTVGKGYGEDLSFDDDYKCPCRCEDPFYSWMPLDDWFCANGERREDER